MPYEAREGEDDGTYEVINVETEEVKAVHEPPDAKEDAERQVRLLNAMEMHEGWDEE